MAQFRKGKSGNPSGRPRGVQDRRVALRAALEGRADVLLAKAVEKALEGDTAVLNTLLSKLIPNLKPETCYIKTCVTGCTPTEQATAIVNSVFSGEMAPSVAVELLNSLTYSMKVKESDELRIRLETLEKKLNVNA